MGRFPMIPMPTFTTLAERTVLFSDHFIDGFHSDVINSKKSK